VRYYARVIEIRKAFRHELFPDEPINEKTNKRYYQLMLSPLKQLPRPIPSLRLRRIVFIPTTWNKFLTAEEINDLYDDSPLEDRLWAELRRRRIEAQRQYFVRVGRRHYALDFAVFCNEGKLDVETDGDTWHADPERIPLDNQRDNDLTGLGWSILRFNGLQVREQAVDYCVPEIMKTVNRLDGVTANGLIPRPFDPEQPDVQQLTLFEAGPDYGVD
jgi:very-short-patch-repair endonuclease